MALATVEFSGKDARRPSARTLLKVRRGMARDGAVRLNGLFPPALLKRIRREVLRRHESGELLRRGLVRDIAGRRTSVLPFEGPFLEPAFYAAPGMLGVMRALLGEAHCVGSLEVVIAQPGAYEQHQHVDGPLRFDQAAGARKLPYRGDLSRLPPYAVGLAVPLCRVTGENGPTAIWRGSHRAALRPRPPGKAEVARRYPVELMTAEFGDAYLFDYRVFHGGTENRSAEIRPLLMFVFTRNWFRDPNQDEVFPSVVISGRDLAKVPARHRGLFLLAPAARRRLWSAR
jgi:ectoine hydroxylase-related dioxygenase (phytanoyl-CoA dioxygenase family)